MPALSPNLPEFRIPLVGRETELAELGRLIEEPHASVVTLTGLPGVGKSRLAVELLRTELAGEDVLEGFRVDLSHAESESDLIDGMATVLGNDVEVGLVHAGSVLIVLDDADRIGEPLRKLVSRWSKLAPAAIFIVTSRAPLGLAAEIVLEVRPLESSAAVEFFGRVATTVRPDFAVSERELPFVTAIVEKLCRLPLAIELAALRSNVLAPRALLARLENRFSVLRAASVPATRAEHESLRAAIESAWDGLDSNERELAMAASVFEGGFAVDDIESVVGRSALDAIDRLRRMSLLRERASPFDDLRLELEGNVRAFVSTMLDESGGRRDWEDRHAAHFARRAEAWARELDGVNAGVAAPRLLSERENVIAVLERAIQRGAASTELAESALTALAAMTPALLARGPLSRWNELLEPLLRATRDSGARPGLVAQALAIRGRVAWQSGDRAGGARDALQAVALARTLDDAMLEARALHFVGKMLVDRGDLDSAEAELARAKSRAETAHATTEIARIESSLGELGMRRARHHEACAHFERALAVFELQNNPTECAAVHRALAELELERGRDAIAEAHADRAVALSQQMGDTVAEGGARVMAGLCRHLRGDHDQAERDYRAAISFAGDTGTRARAHALRAAISRSRGDFAEAFALFAVARRDLESERDRSWIDAELALLGGAPLPAEPELSRWQTRLVEQAPSLHPAQPGDAAESPTGGLSPENALLVGRGALWFRPPQGERVSLERRRPLGLILERLVSARLEQPGSALSRDELLAAGWPDQRVLREAGAHRVRVALSTLRKLGLFGLLRTRSEGYLLDPDTPCVRASS